MKRANFLRRKNERCRLAAENNERWQNLTPQQQLQELDHRLGKGEGAKKQRTKIFEKMKMKESTKV